MTTIKFYYLNYDVHHHNYQLKPFNSSAHSLSDLNIDNRGLAYGDGFFSTMSVYQGQLLWAEHHQNRLSSHAQALQLQLASDQIITLLTNLAQQIKEGIIKVIITRKPQSVVGYGYTRNDNTYSVYNPDKKHADIVNAIDSDVAVFIKTIPMAIPTYSGVNQLITDNTTNDKKNNSSPNMKNALPLSTLPITKLYSLLSTLMSTTLPIRPIGEAICLQSQIACLPKPLVGLKSLNRLDSVIAAGELEHAKIHNRKVVEGLVSDTSGTIDINNSGQNWVEGVSSNVFYQLKSEYTKNNPSRVLGKASKEYHPWFTAPIDRSGVNGVMRQVIIDTMSKAEQPVIERRLSDMDLPHISALFFCNAVRGIIPISKLFLPRTKPLA